MGQFTLSPPRGCLGHLPDRLPVASGGFGKLHLGLDKNSFVAPNWNYFRSARQQSININWLLGIRNEQVTLTITLTISLLLMAGKVRHFFLFIFYPFIKFLFIVFFSLQNRSERFYFIDFWSKEVNNKNVSFSPTDVIHLSPIFKLFKGLQEKQCFSLYNYLLYIFSKLHRT